MGVDNGDFGSWGAVGGSFYLVVEMVIMGLFMGAGWSRMIGVVLSCF